MKDPQVYYDMGFDKHSTYTMYAKLVSKCIHASYVKDCIASQMAWMKDHWCMEVDKTPEATCLKYIHNAKTMYCTQVEDLDKTCENHPMTYYGGFSKDPPPPCPTPKPCPTTTSTTTTEKITTAVPFPTGTLIGGVMLGVLIGTLIMLLIFCLCKKKPSEQTDPETGMTTKDKKKKKKKSKGKTDKTTKSSTGTATSTKGTGTTGGEKETKKEKKKKGKKGKKAKKQDTETATASGY